MQGKGRLGWLSLLVMPGGREGSESNKFGSANG